MQNVDINREVERAMAVSPQQPRGVVDLLASELKARDAKARNQLNAIMAPAPDPNTIISQNERETENNVRQEIAQKMQSMAVKENQNKARMNQALAGIAGQRATNMRRMADGGIVGYADGGQPMMGPPEPNMLQRMGQGLKNIGGNVAESSDILRAAKAGIGVPYENRAAAIQQVRDEIEAQKQNRDPNFIQRMGQKLMDMGLDVQESNRILKEAYSNIGKTYEEKAKGMAMGGIVGYASGGEVEAYLDSIGADAEYKANLTSEQLAAISQMLDAQAAPEASRGIVERMARVGREMPGTNLGDRPTRNAVIEMLDSPVARGQNEVLSALPSGAMGLLQDRMSELGPVSQGAAGANEEATERRRTGIAETLQNAMPEEGVVGRMARVGRRMPGSNLGDRPTRDAMMEGIASLAPTRNPNRVSEFQQRLLKAGDANVTDQLNAAQRRINAEQTVSMADVMRDPATAPAIREAASDFAEGSGLNNLNDMLNRGIQSVRDSDFFSGVPSLEELYPALPEDSSGSYRVGRGINAAFTTIPKVLSGFLQPERGMTFADVAPMAQDLGRGILGDEQGTRTPTEAEEIIASGPSTTPTTPAEPAYDPMKGVEQIANPSLRRAIEGTQAAPASATGIVAPAAEQDGEVAATQLASTVASNPTPQNMSRFESEIQRLMEKRESPVRALSSFLKSFSQARGGSMGQNLAIATTAMNAADDAMDKQIIALEQLRRADQISERDFGLKQEQLQAQKGLLEAQASYYKNYKTMQIEIAELKEAGDTRLANGKLYQSILDLTAANRPAYLMAAKAKLGATDMFSPEVTAEADAMMKQAIQNEYSEAQRFFGLPETSGASLNSAVQEGATATNAQGDKIVFTNGAWTPM